MRILFKSFDCGYVIGVAVEIFGYRIAYGCRPRLWGKYLDWRWQRKTQ